MNRIALAALLLSGCAASAPVSQAAQAHEEPSVSIIATYSHATSPPVTVSLRAETTGMTPPMKFHWSLGNGREWLGARPLPQSYGVGRYDVILTVTDGEGRTKRASVAIDSESHGCGF